MKKAFIFTLDALFAVSILAVFFVVYSFEMNVPKETYWLFQTGNTFMTSLDKNGSFYQTFTQSNPEAALTSYLNLLPKNINANITVKIYTPPFTSAPREINAYKGTMNPTQETHVRRIFSSFDRLEYGLAELVLSYG